jgi:tRNA pseudouridine55 synthase
MTIIPAQQSKTTPLSKEGILLLDKPQGKTSFFLVQQLRRLLKVKCIGHAGTLDPFATGVMVMLIGRPYTKLSNQFLKADKEYLATLCLGKKTDSFDIDGQVINESSYIPSIHEITDAVQEFQGEILQLPPMFSAKKVNGQKLYDLARKGQTIEREKKKVVVETKILSYHHPYLEIYVKCSSGTYIRTIADDLGEKLGCFAHLSNLRRTRSGPFSIDNCYKIEDIKESISHYLRHTW